MTENSQIPIIKNTPSINELNRVLTNNQALKYT